MRTDVAIVGGGPAGACAALYLRRRGIDVMIVEKKSFPRYHVGESMTGEAAAIVRDLGLEERMNAAGHQIKHATAVLGGAARWWIPVQRRTETGELADQLAWQVRRSEFDAMMLEEAGAAGAQLVPGRAVSPLLDDDGTVRGIRVQPTDGPQFELDAHMVLDCSGQATFLAAQGVTGKKYLGAYDKQIAIFSQIVGYERDDGAAGRGSAPGNTLIFYKEKYHWAWAIPLDEEAVSVGVVIPSRYFTSRRESKEQFLARELNELHPDLARRVTDTEFVEEMHAVPNYSFQVRGFAGPGYICVGDSHRFVDPIFSLGLFFALNEAVQAADTTARWLAGEGRDGDDLFHEHMVRCERAIDGAEDLIDCFWHNPFAFAVFAGRRYREPITDALAGRFHIPTAQPVLEASRKVLGRVRTYDREGLFSVPFGSRFHGDDAPSWEDRDTELDSTEAWIAEEYAAATAVSCAGSETAAR
jgi:flavin-dependent dehydrogenase